MDGEEKDLAEQIWQKIRVEKTIFLDYGDERKVAEAVVKNEDILLMSIKSADNFILLVLPRNRSCFLRRLARGLARVVIKKTRLNPLTYDLHVIFMSSLMRFVGSSHL
ncbi:hypothetical protein [Coxiella-like endosymbiont]|uniref:hypothetical protein n=1 Tax=Coxiella-like endosymbiont TaxID=1592897 RepID=UPI00272978DF|nr:hypothetical protein [Coxiella-like endosymbiont]